MSSLTIQINSILLGEFSIYTPLANINFNSEQIWQKKENIQNIQRISTYKYNDKTDIFDLMIIYYNLV